VSSGSKERTHESPFIGQKDLYQLQNHTPQRRCARDLQKPEAQAATGLIRHF
jgi:hypothetical protein